MIVKDIIHGNVLLHITCLSTSFKFQVDVTLAAMNKISFMIDAYSPDMYVHLEQLLKKYYENLTDDEISEIPDIHDEDYWESRIYQIRLKRIQAEKVIKEAEKAIKEAEKAIKEAKKEEAEMKAEMKAELTAEVKAEMKAEMKAMQTNQSEEPSAKRLKKHVVDDDDYDTLPFNTEEVFEEVFEEETEPMTEEEINELLFG
jgi:hypothetical protein